MASEAVKSPLEQVWRQIVPRDHDQALRNAFYNVAAVLFVVGAAAAAWSVYHILQPFIQALGWAVLIGSMLHPLKFKLVSIVKDWLIGVQETNSLLSFSISLMPFACIDNFTDIFGNFVMVHMQGVIAVTIVLPLAYLIIHHTPSSLSFVAYSSIYLIYNSLKLFLDIIAYFNILVVTLILVYTISVFTHMDENNEKLFRRCSFPLWLVICALFSTLVQSCFQVPLFLFMICLLLLGVGNQLFEHFFIETKGMNATSVRNILQTVFKICVGDKIEESSKSKEKISDAEIKDLDNGNEDQPSLTHCESSDINSTTPKKKLDETIAANTDSNSQNSDSTNGQTILTNEPTVSTNYSTTKTNDRTISSDDTTDFSNKLKSNPSRKSAAASRCEENELSSNTYLKTVFLACILATLWRHKYLLSLLPIAVAYYAVKKATSYHIFGEGFFHSYCRGLKERCDDSCRKFSELKMAALLPSPVIGVFKLLKRGDEMTVKLLTQSIDSFATILIMIAFAIFIFSTSIFLAVQIQREGVHLLTIGSEFVNSSIVNNPQFNDILPDEFHDVMSSALDSGYVHGREWLRHMIKSTLGETSDEKSEMLEQKILELWDRVFQAWVVTPSTEYKVGPTVTSDAVVSTFDSIVDGFKKSPGLISFSTLSEMVRENLDTVKSVLEGIWSILHSNLTLIFSATTTTLSVLLGGSLSILNAFLSIIVFLSALFYLVSISDDVYKPVAVISNLSPGQINTLGSAVEDSINGVFLASLKMGLFYGMWTWLLHSVFDTNIVYIPSVLGALFGAVPLLGTYWAAIPAVLELVWARESPFMGLFLMVAQMLPMFCIDTAIYSEIKGGAHPYLTGLAVAGGVFCWGVQGAFFGPLLLCILLMATKMYTSLIQTPASQLQFNPNIKKFKRTLTLI